MTTNRLIFGQENREELLAAPRRNVFRKKARILAWKMVVPFVVETDRGPMTGEPGDWLVTNHPDDDPGSDLWTISADRMAATYERAE